MGTGAVQGDLKFGIKWCDCTADKKLSLSKISVTPISIETMQEFVDTPDGLKQDKWWDDLAIVSKRWNQENTVSSYANNMNWYTAVAFCNWLGSKFPGTFRLPTEEELLNASEITFTELSEWCMNDFKDPKEIDLQSGWHKAIRGEFSHDNIETSLDTRIAGSPINAYAFVGFRVVMGGIARA